jgi:hypothetical protein
VPILWLSLFDTDAWVTWPGIRGSSFTAVVQPRSECIERSGARLGDWSRRWPEVFALTTVRQVAEELTVRESMIFLDGREFTGEPPGLRTVQRGLG